MTAAKNAQLEQIYDELNPQQSAAMVLAYAMSGDEAGLDSLTAAVLRRAGCSSEHIAWLGCFTNMAAFWGISYWRTMAISVAQSPADSMDNPSKGLCINDEDPELLALDAALDSVCMEYGLDPSAIRVMAQVPFPYASSDVLCDQVRVEVIRLQLVRLIEAWKLA